MRQVHQLMLIQTCLREEFRRGLNAPFVVIGLVLSASELEAAVDDAADVTVRHELGEAAVVILRQERIRHGNPSERSDGRNGGTRLLWVLAADGTGKPARDLPEQCARAVIRPDPCES